MGLILGELGDGVLGFPGLRKVPHQHWQARSP